MFRDSLIEYCSPTLASLKLGSLFRYEYQDLDTLERTISKERHWLKAKGVSMEVVSTKGHSTLIYLFRDNLLKTTLQDSQVQTFLSGYGYRTFDVDGCVTTLKEHFQTTACPHEVGIFLGYPLCDVVGFIDNCGRDCKLCGYWKVYGDEVEAQKTFSKYSKCRNVYKRLFSEGFSIKRLTVSM
jgi:hypothetical protein